MEPRNPNDQFSLPSVPSAASPLPPMQQGSAMPAPPPTPAFQPALASDPRQLLAGTIARAQQISAQYHDKPYEQSLALQQLKADYLKARYQLDVKVAPD